MPDQPAISIQGVTKCFGNVTAVEDLYLEVPQGSLIGFLGPNGAGKSTTIRMIMSIIYPDRGTVSVLGRTALDAKDRIGYLPEERGLYRRMRVRAFLRYVGRLKGMDAVAADRAATSWLDMLELPQAMGRRCEELSKGQQQKIQFVATILHDPDLIVLDEPFSGLDPINAALMSKVIERLHEEGRTIVFSTHVLHQAEQLCDRIFLINQGAKLLDDDIETIRARHRQHIVVVDRDGAETPPTLEGTRATIDPNDPRHVELHVDDDVDLRHIMRQAIEWPDVKSVSIRQPLLEDIFSQLVGAEAMS